MNTMRERAEVNKLLGIDSSLIYPDQIRELCPELDLSDHPTWPVMGALYHLPGGIIRHDAVVWGYARGADRGGVEIHQNTEVTGITQAGGCVTGVRTTRGDIECDTVISATVVTPIATGLHARGEQERERQLVLEGGKYALAAATILMAQFVLLGRPLIACRAITPRATAPAVRRTRARNSSARARPRRSARCGGTAS